MIKQRSGSARRFGRPYFALVGGSVAFTLAAASATLVAAGHAAGADGGSNLFITSAVEHPDGTASFPLHMGTSHGQPVFFIVLDASDGNLASDMGVNTSAKLANAANSGAVQHVMMVNGVVDFPATVDFNHHHQVAPGPNGFPPSQAEPGAVGEQGYSPLIQLPDGTILNAPQIANQTGRADKVVAMDTGGGTVTYRETAGFQGGKAVHYVSTDSSNPVAAALEDVTLAPALNNAPTLDDDSTDSARASLAAFTNGQTGADNPQRQGLNSALLDGLSPLNVLRWNPSQGRYSPLWDVHLASWTAAAVTAGENQRQTDFGQILGLANKGTVTSPDGSPFAAAGFIVDCPIVSQAG